MEYDRSRQQDSQEFLRYLLQGLHEDVNRVQRKPSPMKIDEKAEARMKSVWHSFIFIRTYFLFVLISEKDLAKLSWERSLRYDDSPMAGQ